MKVALLSDTHFGGLGEPYFKLVEKLKAIKPDLILNAGDYSNEYNPRVINALSEACEDIAPTHGVFGNHDWYNNPLKPEVDEVQCHVVDGKVIISATLWTNYFGGNPFEMLDTKRYLADFIYIKNWTPERQLILYHNQLKQIDDWLRFHREEECIVLTHHAPILECVHPRFRGKGLNGSFVNQLEQFIEDRPQIKFWCHGHVHDDVDVSIGNTRILCRPRGYRGEQNYDDYEPKVFEI